MKTLKNHFFIWNIALFIVFLLQGCVSLPESKSLGYDYQFRTVNKNEYKIDTDKAVVHYADDGKEAKVSLPIKNRKLIIKQKRKISLWEITNDTEYYSKGDKFYRVQVNPKSNSWKHQKDAGNDEGWIAVHKRIIKPWGAVNYNNNLKVTLGRSALAESSEIKNVNLENNKIKFIIKISDKSGVRLSNRSFQFNQPLILFDNNKQSFKGNILIGFNGTKNNQSNYKKESSKNNPTSYPKISIVNWNDYFIEFDKKCMSCSSNMYKIYIDEYLVMQLHKGQKIRYGASNSSGFREIINGEAKGVFPSYSCGNLKNIKIVDPQDSLLVEKKVMMSCGRKLIINVGKMLAKRDKQKSYQTISPSRHKSHNEKMQNVYDKASQYGLDAFNPLSNKNKSIEELKSAIEEGYK